MALPTDDTVVTGPRRHSAGEPSLPAEARRKAVSRYAALLAESYSRMPMLP